MTTGQKIAEQLRIAAALYEQMGRKTGPEPREALELVVDGTRFKIVAEACADGLRNRADEIEKQERRLAGNTRGYRDYSAASRFKPTSGRSQYSAKVEASLAEEDPANAEQYRGLFDA